MVAASDILMLPASAFYWAEIDASSLPRRLRASREHLAYLAEPFLPASLDEIQLDFVRTGDSTWLAVGMPHDRIDAIASSFVQLRPSHGPDFETSMPMSEPDLARINLLRDRHEPASIQLARRRAVGLAAVIMIGCTVLACLGMQRRANGLNAAIAELRLTVSDIYRETLGPANSRQSRPIQMLAELRALQRAANAEARDANASDVTPILTSLLAKWPGDLHALTNHVIVTNQGASIEAIVPEHDDAAAFRAALASSEDELSVQFDVPSPGLRTVKDGVRITVQPSIAFDSGDM
ncbi:MAG: hypothetical protein AAF432_03310 [Planctomycetota bacterium]